MGLVYDRRGREDDRSGIVQAQAMRLVKPLQAIYPPSRMWPSSRIRMMYYLEQIAISSILATVSFVILGILAAQIYL